MRSIRFSDQVYSNGTNEPSRFRDRRNSYAEGGITSRRNGNHGYEFLPMRELPSSRSFHTSVTRRNSDRSYYSGPPPSIAASDTSSAAGFIPHRNAAINRYGGLTRGYAVDKTDIANGTPALYQRSSSQSYMDDMDYRTGLGVTGGIADAGSAATSSPFSQRSVDSSSNYNQSSTSGGTIRPASATPQQQPIARDPILKNGTLPRSMSRTSHYSRSISVGHNGSGAIKGNGEGPVDMRSRNSYGNGSISLNSKPTIAARRQAGPNTTKNSELNRDVIRNPMIRRDEAGFPLLPRPASSVQIIATPHKPCFDCACWRENCGGGAGAANANGKSTPICVLFAIFLVFSLAVVSGVMIYLRGGKIILAAGFY